MPIKKNARKQDKLVALSKGLENYEEILIKGEKLSFSIQFLDENQKAGYRFRELDEKTKDDIFYELKHLSKESRNYWMHQRVGGGGLNVLEIYGNFPVNSEFELPTHVPSYIKWARFRFGNKRRLVGFFLDDEYAEKHKLSKEVFYIVFIDLDHKFYTMEKA